MKHKVLRKKLLRLSSNKLLVECQKTSGMNLKIRLLPMFIVLLSTFQAMLGRIDCGSRVGLRKVGLFNNNN